MIFVMLIFLILFIASSDQNKIREASYTPLEYTLFTDDFNSYPLGNCKADNELIGSWLNIYSGNGCVTIEGDNTN